MKRRQAQNAARAVPAEEWAYRRFKALSLELRRQYQWGCRVFDFFFPQKGIAVEIDGDTHDKHYDHARDNYNLHRSAILVIRVRNFNEADLEAAIRRIRTESWWRARRMVMKEKFGVSPDECMKQVVVTAGLPLAHGRWSPRKK